MGGINWTGLWFFCWLVYLIFTIVFLSLTFKNVMCTEAIGLCYKTPSAVPPSPSAKAAVVDIKPASGAAPAPVPPPAPTGKSTYTVERYASCE